MGNLSYDRAAIVPIGIHFSGETRFIANMLISTQQAGLINYQH